MLVFLYLLALRIDAAQGAHAWAQALAEARAAGEPTKFAEIVPAREPDAENFAALPIFRPLLDYDRLAHQAWPPSLDALAPVYLPAGPHDPVSGGKFSTQGGCSQRT